MSAATPLVIAHRGHSAAKRENSAASWAAAIAAGAYAIEADIRRTTDDELVCCHDADLSRIAGRPERVADCAWAELAPILVAGEPAAPRLVDLLETVPASMPLVMDIKDERPETLALIARTVSARRASDTVFAGLRDMASIPVMRSLCGFRILGLLADPESDAALAAMGGEVLRLWERHATPERLGRLAARGRPAWVTTGGPETGREVGILDAGSLAAMARAGAAGFLVDDPAGARAILAEAGA